MPYIEGKEITVHECENYMVKYISWKREGQCVTMTPPNKFKVYLHTGRDRGTVITIDTSRCNARTRLMAMDIGDLFS